MVLLKNITCSKFFIWSNQQFPNNEFFSYAKNTSYQLFFRTCARKRPFGTITSIVLIVFIDNRIKTDCLRTGMKGKGGHLLA